jgi:hypothetical protein
MLHRLGEVVQGPDRETAAAASEIDFGLREGSAHNGDMVRGMSDRGGVRPDVDRRKVTMTLLVSDDSAPMALAMPERRLGAGALRASV